MEGFIVIEVDADFLSDVEVKNGSIVSREGCFVKAMFEKAVFFRVNSITLI